MKRLLILLMFLSGGQANAWNKIIECNNGELVVDQGDNDSMGRPTYQLVLRGRPLNYFIQTGAVDPKSVNNKNEFIIWLNTYDSELLGFQSYGTAPNGMQIYRNFHVSHHYGDVRIGATIGNRISGENEKANWLFHNCR